MEITVIKKFSRLTNWLLTNQSKFIPFYPGLLFYFNGSQCQGVFFFCGPISQHMCWQTRIVNKCWFSEIAIWFCFIGIIETTFNPVWHSARSPLNAINISHIIWKPKEYHIQIDINKSSANIETQGLYQILLYWTIQTLTTARGIYQNRKQFIFSSRMTSAIE